MEKKAFIERYGLNKGSLRWVSPGGEILRYIGMDVAVINFAMEKSEVEGEHAKVKSTTGGLGRINSISDYDPMTGTYKINYTMTGIGETEPKEMRIIPEGFSFNQPDVDLSMTRFIPLSLHYAFMEAENFYTRLAELFDKRDTLPIEVLSQITESKEKEQTLNYFCNIGALIRTSEGEMLHFRLRDLKIKHLHKDRYDLILSDGHESYVLSVSDQDKVYKFKQGKEEIGELKIVDIED